jgi:hypothetical protein
MSRTLAHFDRSGNPASIKLVRIIEMKARKLLSIALMAAFEICAASSSAWTYSSEHVSPKAARTFERPATL